MPRRTPFLLLAAMALIATTGTLSAQAPSTIDQAGLDAAVAEQPADARAVLGNALSSEQAVAAAKTLGLSADDVQARIAALDDADADRLAQRVLAGGDRIVISATALIIILLLIILITD